MASSIAGDGDLVSYGQIVLFGDSITEQSFNSEYSGFGSALANAYARRLDIINRGFSGYTTDQAVELLPRIFPTLDNDIQLVVVFFGANDAVLPGFDQHVPIDRFRTNMRTILSSPALKGKVIVLTPPPIESHTHDPNFGPNRTAENTKLFRDTVLLLCKELDVPSGDVWKTFMDTLGWQEVDEQLPGSLKAPKSDLLASYFRDGLHPVASGYELIYQTIRTAIESSFPAIAPLKREYHTPYWYHAIMPKSDTMIRWRLDTTKWSVDHYTELLNTLPPSDQDRISRFYFQKDRSMALGSTLLQRKFISEVLGLAPGLIKTIKRDANNRPFLTHKAVRPDDFNVSHHGNCVVLAGYVRRGRVGVDLTTIEPPSQTESPSEYLENFRDVFSTAEWRDIDGDVSKFAQHWALKEAYVKATGTGIVVELKSIEFHHVKYVDADNPIQRDAAQLVIDDRIQSSLQVGDAAKYWFELHFVNGQYIAVASNHKVDPGSFIETSF